MKNTRQPRDLDQLFLDYQALSDLPSRQLCLLLVFYRALSGQVKDMSLQNLPVQAESTSSWRVRYQAAYFDRDQGRAFRKALKKKTGYLLSPEALWPVAPQDIRKKLSILATCHPVFRQLLQAFEPLLDLPVLVELAQRLSRLDCSIDKLALSPFLAYYKQALDDALSEQRPCFPELLQACLAQVDQHKYLSIYDANLDDGTYLAWAWQTYRTATGLAIYGHSRSSVGLGLTLMQLIILGAQPQQLHLYQGQYLDGSWPMSQTLYLDVIFLYQAQTQAWSADKAYLKTPAFAPFGVLPPASKGDWAHVLLAYHRLKQGGCLLAILPAAALSRKQNEAQLRKSLAQQGAFEAVISLPSSAFVGQESLVLLVLKKGGATQSTFYLDGEVVCEGRDSHELGPVLAQAYRKGQVVEGQSALVSWKTLVAQADNLSPSVFISSTKSTSPALLELFGQRLTDIQAQLAAEKEKLVALLAELKVEQD